MNSVLASLTKRRKPYLTLPGNFYVEVSDRTQVIETLEGPVECHLGDAIVTGVNDERYPVPAKKFSDKFEPVPGQTTSNNGFYTKRIREVEAVKLDAPLSLELTDGRGTLSGKPGDWCVWYDKKDESNAAIVASDIFPKLYESYTVCVFVELGRDLTTDDKRSVRLAIATLEAALTNTEFVCSEESPDKISDYPIWFRVVTNAIVPENFIPEVMELSVSSVIAAGPVGLINLVRQATELKSVFSFSMSKLIKPSPTHSKNNATESLVKIVALQLAAVEHFNTNLRTNWNNQNPYPFIDNRDQTTEPAGLNKISHIGAVADQLATDFQKKWQGLVFATTNEIADKSVMKLSPRPFQTLITLGLIAAGMLAAFCELRLRCDPNDPWGFEFCASSTWAHWAGPFILFFYLSALVLAWYRYSKAKTEQWEVRHQDFRLLAECNRVMYVRSVLGMTAWAASDLPPAEPSDSGWVKLALHSIYFNARESGLKSNVEDSKTINQAMQSFIGPQVKYHKENLLRRRETAIKKLSKFARYGFLFFISNLLIVTANVIAEIFHHPLISPMMDHVALICLVLGLGVWGGIRKVIDTFGLEQELQRGRLVLSNLAQAEKDGSRNAILKAVNYFLEDQAHWHALHRSKPIEAATGG